MDPPTALKNDNVDDKPSAELLEMGVAPVDFRPAGKGRPAHYVEIDPAAEKKLLLKLDLILLPIVTICNLFSFIDRANIGNARVAGLDAEVGLRGFDFQYVQMLFYVMYLVVEVPSNLIFKRVGSIWLAFLVIGFGVTSIGTAFIQTKGQLYATRFLLGTFEGGLLPGFSYLLSRYYRRQEFVFRIGVFLALSPSLSGACGGLLAYGFLRSGNVGSVIAWRKIFLWEGLITTVLGIAALYLIPNWPEKTRFLNEEERYIAIHRVQNEDEQTNEADQAEKWTDSVRGALGLPVVLCTVAFAGLNSVIQGMAVFMPSIIRTLGRYTALEIQLRTVPPFVVAAVWAVGLTYYGWKAQKRSQLVMISMPIAIIGFILFLAAHQPTARYAACFLAFTGAVPLGPVFIAIGVNNTSGATSRGIVSGIIPGIATIGSVVGMWCFTNSQAPRFMVGNALNLCFCVMGLGIAVFLMFFARRQNAAKERGDHDHLLEGKNEHEIKQLRHKHPDFRYIE